MNIFQKMYWKCKVFQMSDEKLVEFRRLLLNFNQDRFVKGKYVINLINKRLDN